MANLEGKLASWSARYLYHEMGLTKRSVDQFLEAFADTDRFTAWDSLWCSETFTVKTLSSAVNASLLSELEGMGCDKIPAELLIEMKTAKSKNKFNTIAMERVAEAMRFKDGELDGVTDTGSRASALTEGSHETDGKETNRSVTTEQVQQDISRFRTEFGRLTIELREISPDDSLFATPLFADSSDPMDDMSINSSASTELKNIMKATKKQVIQL